MYPVTAKSQYVIPPLQTAPPPPLRETLAKASVNNNLLKYSVKGYLLNGGLCALCGGDLEVIMTCIEKYEDLDALGQMIAAGQLRGHVQQSFMLADVVSAFNVSYAGNVVGKIGLKGMNPILFALIREVISGPLLCGIAAVLEPGGRDHGEPYRAA